jgi:hypothetical protein
VHPPTGTALNLSPLYFWGLNNLGNPNEDPDLYEFDSTTKESFSYKAVQFREPRIIDGEGDLQQIWRKLANMRVEDPHAPVSEGLSLGPEGVGGS